MYVNTVTISDFCHKHNVTIPYYHYIYIHQASCVLECHIEHTLSNMGPTEQCEPWYLPPVDANIRLCSPFEARNFTDEIDKLSNEICKVCSQISSKEQLWDMKIWIVLRLSYVMSRLWNLGLGSGEFCVWKLLVSTDLRRANWRNALTNDHQTYQQLFDACWWVIIWAFHPALPARLWGDSLQGQCVSIPIPGLWLQELWHLFTLQPWVNLAPSHVGS